LKQVQQAHDGENSYGREQIMIVHHDFGTTTFTVLEGWLWLPSVSVTVT